MESDRRASQRQAAIVAVEIDAPSRTGRVGVTRDASATGMLMTTPSRFEVGDELALTLFLMGDRAKVRGRVIRVETTRARSNEVWRYRLAVEFIEPLTVSVDTLPS